MKLRIELTTIAVIAWGLTAVDIHAQRGSTAPASESLTVTAVVGCVSAEGQQWFLTDASQPIVVPAADGKTMTGSGVTVDRARQEPAGKERYRLMNMVNDFGVPAHKGQRALVKGLVLGTRADRRINIVSFEPIAPSCR